MEYIEKKDKAYRRVLTCMLLGSIVTFAVLYAPQPLINVFSKQYHVSPATASASISLPTLALAVSLLFIPLISRRIGRKRIMGISLFATSVLAVISAFSHNFGFFLFIRLLEGISVSGFPAIAIAYLNEEISPASIGGTMGAYVAGTAVGGFVGRVAIGPLTDLFSWQVAFFVLGFLCFLCSLYFWFYLPQSRNFESEKISVFEYMKALGAGLKSKRLFLLYCMGFLVMGSYIMLFNYIGYPLTEPPYNLSQTVLGFLFVVNLIGTWSSMMFGRLADQHSRQRLMGVSCGIFVLGALLTLIPSIWIKIMGITVFVFGFFGAHTTASGWVGVAAPTNRKATASSLYLLFYYMGSSVIGWAGGFVWIDFHWLGLVCAICLFMLLCYGLSILTAESGKIMPKPN
ncbi:MFS transporter [Neobacillus ginsengisoli]|uniref:YNFM family putative membrane transporter n=1 Tax=Neobacillus ginsengisoli TaxID=904295 RepID=A0ABT9XWT7_9BACI|nr:MFS transporter [Neobacillus ginsengisoli]MDQ0199725.1 YNFM family putative membrane transporter [Neobacillus ginsengisoli]